MGQSPATMSQDNNGWGKDRDDDGNVIGEVPDNESNSLLMNHPGKIFGVWILWFALSIFGNQFELSPGVLIGAGGMSFVLSFVLVWVYVWFRY